MTTASVQLRATCVGCGHARLLDIRGRCRACASAHLASQLDRHPAIRRQAEVKAKQREYFQRPEVKAQHRQQALASYHRRKRLTTKAEAKA